MIGIQCRECSSYICCNRYAVPALPPGLCHPVGWRIFDRNLCILGAAASATLRCDARLSSPLEGSGADAARSGGGYFVCPESSQAERRTFTPRERRSEGVQPFVQPFSEKAAGTGVVDGDASAGGRSFHSRTH
jgi:hypothetical protein